MKKLTLVLAFLLSLGTVFNSKAQGLAYEQGDNLLSVGTSFFVPVIPFGYSRVINFPPVMSSFEIGFNEYVSAGPYIGYSARRWRASDDYLYRDNAIAIGARASFHFWGLLADALNEDLSQDKLDIYFTISPGFRIETDNFNDRTEYDTTVRVRLFNGNFGLRYYLTDNIAIYLEGGRVFRGFANFGLTFKM